MADQAQTILTNLKAAIEAERASGHALSYIAGCFVVQHPIQVQMDDSAPLPLVLIYPTVLLLTPGIAPRGQRSNQKVLTVTVSIFEEYFDQTDGVLGNTTTGKKGILTMAADLETLLDRNTLSNTVIQTILRTISFQPVSLPGFVSIHQAHLTLEFTYLDRR